jgi:hypothetical protein
MAAQKGHPKTGGRGPGIKNKKTLLLETFAQTITEGGMERFQNELNNLTGKEYCNAFMALFQYVVPKLNRTEIKDTTEPDYRPQLIIMNEKGEILDGRL